MQEFLNHRQNFASQMQDNSVAIIMGSQQKFRNADSEYKFRQNSDCYYLSGISDPSVVLVITKQTDNQFKYLVFAKTLTKEQLVWVSVGIDLNTAVSKYGADKACAIADLELELPNIIRDKQTVYYSFGLCSYLDSKMQKLLNYDPKIPISIKTSKFKVLDPRKILHTMRLIKSSTEIEFMRRAASVSANAHNKLMQICKPGLQEYQLEAKFAFETMYNGCQSQAYSAIVGSGNNATILHYINNNCEIKDGDLVLVDAGGEYKYYASDITRTFPANGKFSSKQKDLYEVVLAAQKSGIAEVKPGNTWENIHGAVVKIVSQGLYDLKIIPNTPEEILSKELYKNFYMHFTGHWLGLDVHDSGYSKTEDKLRALEPGMTLTVEPGIYIDQNNTTAASPWRGMGIRIEDDILVTQTGCEVLSKEALKEVADIEYLMQ